MDESEKKLLLEIDNLYSQLQNEPNGRWNGTYLMEPSGNRYIMNANLILDKIIELKNEFNPDYISNLEVSALRHTCNKEVKYVEYHYDRAQKKNAPKIRQTELLKSMHEASCQIHMDLIFLFKKIDELKKEVR